MAVWVWGLKFNPNTDLIQRLNAVSVEKLFQKALGSTLRELGTGTKKRNITVKNAMRDYGMNKIKVGTFLRWLLIFSSFSSIEHYTKYDDYAYCYYHYGSYNPCYWERL